MKNRRWTWSLMVGLPSLVLALVICTAAVGGLREEYGDGAWHDIGGGWQYRYISSVDDGYWLHSGVCRFGFDYGPGEWWHHGTTWSRLSGAGLTEGDWVGDGNWHSNLVSGWSYRYVTGISGGYWNNGRITQFSYDYIAGTWWDHSCWGPWFAFGSLGLSQQFIGDGEWHELGTIGDRDWQFLYSGDQGHWQLLLGSDWTDRFVYNYRSGQWQDNRADGWHYLGAEGVSCAFLGDGITHPLGDSFTYQFLSLDNVGLWYLDATHYFRYMYYATEDPWSYSLNGGDLWLTWGQTTLAADTYMGGDGNPQGFAVGQDGMLYFGAFNDDGFWDVYRWDGSSLTNISETGFSSLKPGPQISDVGAYFIGQLGGYYDLYLWDGEYWTQVNDPANEYLDLSYFTTSGDTSYYAAKVSGSPSNLYYLYKAVGDAWIQVYADPFKALSYATQTTGGGLFFYGSTAAGDYYVYRLHDGTLDQISHPDLTLSAISYQASNSTDLFFQARINGGLVDFYRVWDDEGTWTFTKISTTSFNNLSGRGVTFNEDVYFYQWFGSYSWSEVFRWDGTGLQWYQVTDIYSHMSGWLNESVVGGALYFMASPDYEFTFYRCVGNDYVPISDPGVYVNQYAGAIGSTYYYVARDESYNYDLYAWNGSSFGKVTNYNFADLEFATERDGALYFTAQDAADDTYGVFRFDGASTWVDTPYTTFYYAANLGTEGLTWQYYDSGASKYYLGSYNPTTCSFGQWSAASMLPVYDWTGTNHLVPFNRDYYFSGMLEGSIGYELMRYWGDYQYLTGRAVPGGA